MDRFTTLVLSGTLLLVMFGPSAVRSETRSENVALSETDLESLNRRIRQLGEELRQLREKDCICTNR